MAIDCVTGLGYNTAMYRRSLLLFLIVIGCMPGGSSALSVIRPGEPRIRFNKVVAPARAEQGEELRIVAFVTPLQNIWENEQIFFHLITPDAVIKDYPPEGWEQKGIVVNANTRPLIASQNWVVGSDVQLGPITLLIPKSLPPGKYLYQMGLFNTVTSPRKVYMREPYANKEIKDWIVGSVEVEAGRVREAGGKEETVLSDFENLEDVKKWESGRKGEIGLVSGAAALDGNYSALLAFPAGAPMPIVMLQSFFVSAAPDCNDWEDYDYLEFLLRGSFDPHSYGANKLTLQIKDAGGARFQRPLQDLERSKAGEQKGDAGGVSGAPVYLLKLPIADVAESIDVGNIRHLGFFASGLPEQQGWFLTVTIDDLTLVAPKGRRPEAEEPFIIYEGADYSDTTYPGGILKVSARFTIARRFKQNYRVFIHAIQETPPHFSMNVDRDPFRSTTTWEVGKIHEEGPIEVMVPANAPPGKYVLNVGLFRMRSDVGTEVRYVKTYRWSDGIFTEEQPTSPIDYVRLPYLNRTSKEQWRVGVFTVLEKRGRPAAGTAEERQEMRDLVTGTEKNILSKPPPPLEIKSPVRRLEQRTVPE